MPRMKTLAEELADLAHTAPAGIDNRPLCFWPVLHIKLLLNMLRKQGDCITQTWTLS